MTDKKPKEIKRKKPQETKTTKAIEAAKPPAPSEISPSPTTRSPDISNDVQITEADETPSIDINEKKGEPQKKEKPTESDIIRTIVAPSDWEEALTELILEQGLDPLHIDIIRLTDAFMTYLNRIQSFSFRIPGRFILIAAILLSMKAESLLSHEEERLSRLGGVQEIPDLGSPLLTPPPSRQAVRPVSLTDLISALNKAFEMKVRKESILRPPPREFPLPMHRAEDVEKRITELYENILRHGKISFTDLVPAWRRKEIISTFTPLLHLVHRGRVLCEQAEPFKEISIRLK